VDVGDDDAGEEASQRCPAIGFDGGFGFGDEPEQPGSTTRTPTRPSVRPTSSRSAASPSAAGACTLDAAVHAWDIAVATGQPSPLPDELAEALLAVAKEIPSERPDLGNAVRLARDSAPGGQCRSTAKMRVRPVIRDR
jgi:hypothetical protein